MFSQRSEATVVFSSNGSMASMPEKSNSSHHSPHAQQQQHDRRSVVDLKMQYDTTVRRLVPASTSVPSATTAISAAPILLCDYMYSGDILRMVYPMNTNNTSSSRPSLFCYTAAGNGVWVPDGYGTMELIEYELSPSSTTHTMQATGETGPVGSPTSATFKEPQLERVVMLSIMYRGEFLEGKRHGTGTLTITKPQSPKHYEWSMTCEWANNVPILDRFPCRLSAPPGTLDDDNTGSPMSTPAGSFANPHSSTDNGWSRNHSFASATGGGTGNERPKRPADQYVGMLSTISDGQISSKADYEGLAWVLRVRFVPDGTGELLGADKRRYCGEWQCGQRHGFGLEVDPTGQTTFVGGFQYDAREGPGTLLRPQLQTSITGLWSDGQLLSHDTKGAPNGASAGSPHTTSVHLPRRGAVLQATNWQAAPHTSGMVCNADTLAVCRSRAVDGIWEPLFVSFDGILLNAFSDFLLAPTTTHSQQRSTAAFQTPDRGPDGAQALLMLLRKAFQKDEFVAMLATFQRCMYFLYGCCLTNPTSNSGCCTTDAASLSSSVPFVASSMAPRSKHNCTSNTSQQSGADSSTSVSSSKGPQRITGSTLSWCSMMGLDSVTGCIHQQSVKSNSAASGVVREKQYTLALLRQALAHVGSFVFSLRLRLLSLVAAVPAACDLNPGRDILELCWDVAFGYVEPLIHAMASFVTSVSNAQFSLTQKRLQNVSLFAFLKEWVLDETKEGSNDGSKDSDMELIRQLSDALEEQLPLCFVKSKHSLTDVCDDSCPSSPFRGTVHSNILEGESPSSPTAVDPSTDYPVTLSPRGAASAKGSSSELQYLTQRLHHVLFDHTHRNGHQQDHGNTSTGGAVLQSSVSRSNAGAFVTFAYASPLNGSDEPSSPTLSAAEDTATRTMLPALHSSTSCLIQPSSTIRYLLQFLKRLRRLLAQITATLSVSGTSSFHVNPLQLEEQVLSYLLLTAATPRNVEAKLLVLSLLIADEAVDPRLPGSLSSLGLTDVGFLSQGAAENTANDQRGPSSGRDLDVVQDPEVDSRASLASLEQISFLMDIVRRSAFTVTLPTAGTTTSSLHFPSSRQWKSSSDVTVLNTIVIRQRCRLLLTKYSLS